MVIPPELPRFVAAARPGALQALALQSGQVLDARVVGPAANGVTQVEIRGQLLNLVLPTLVQAGETIRLEVQGAGQQMRLALQQATAPLPHPARTSTCRCPIRPPVQPRCRRRQARHPFPRKWCRGSRR